MATNLESSLHISDLILQASPVVQLVMLILLLASIFSWYLIAKLQMGFKKASQNDEHFQKMFWSGAELNTLYNNAQLNSKRNGLEDIFYQGLGEFFKLQKRKADTNQTIEGTERILRVGLSRDQGGLEQGLGALASIGSVAPYIGLFGTVWGIMNAFIGLAAVDQIRAVCLQERRGFDALQVGAGTRLGHGDGGDHLATHQLGQVVLLLRLAAVMQDIGRDDIGMQGEADAGQAQATDFLDHHGAIEEVRCHAAVFFREMRAEHAGLPRLVPQGAIDMAILFPLGMKRYGLLLEKPAHAVAELFVFGAENRSGDHDNTYLIGRF